MRSVSLIQFTRFFLIRWINLTAFLQELPQPVIVLTICLNGSLYDIRKCCMEILINRSLRPFNNPAHNCRTCMLKQIIRIILDVTFTCNLCIEGNDHQPSPDTVIIGSHLREMVRIENQRM